MKHILAPILLTVFLFPSLAVGEEVTIHNLVQREGLYYQKFTDVPFTGQTTGQKQGTFKNGKKEGPWVTYYDNGQLEPKGNYKNGKWDGPWIGYRRSGRLYWKGDYKNELKEGPWVFYHKDGTVNEHPSGNYKNGVKVE